MRRIDCINKVIIGWWTSRTKIATNIAPSNTILSSVSTTEFL